MIEKKSHVFLDMEVDKTQENDQQLCFRNYIFFIHLFFFSTCKYFDVSSLF